MINSNSTRSIVEKLILLSRYLTIFVYRSTTTRIVLYITPPRLLGGKSVKKSIDNSFYNPLGIGNAIILL